MASYKEYSEIKQVVEKYWVLAEGKKYEDFIKELVMILRL